MTDTNETLPDSSPTSGPAASADARPARKGGGLASKLLPELKQIAGGLGVRTNGMKKADLVAAIQQAQQGHQQGQQQGQSRQEPPQQAKQQQAKQDGQQKQDQPAEQKQDGQQGQRKQDGQQDKKKRDGQQDKGQQDKGQQDKAQQDKGQPEKGQPEKGQQDKQKAQNQQQGRAKGQPSQQQNQPSQQNQPQDGQQDQNDDDEGGSRRNRRRRGRDRTAPQSGRGNRNEPDLTVLDDDVLAPCAGILDVLDNYAFVRTSGYLPGTEDVYVSMSMVRKYGLRRGDALTGQVRQPREGERREKFNPLVQIDSVNGGDPESVKDRVQYDDLTPVHPTERLRLETGKDDLVGRIIDLVAPIGKGQRGLIVSPAKAGKTAVLKAIASSVTANHPESHLMVVLVDERPEEVTDYQRAVRGEVVSSTFDRPVTDHTTVAELAIERAKRLVELGHDVVVLLDGITRLARAYNLAAPSGGRILEGGVDSTALHPTKQFFGAARNIENGGSLTILATALVESGSTVDEAIFEELQGTGNLEIRLRRELADKRLFPSIDALQSGTRHEELLMSPEEVAIVQKLRAMLSGLDQEAALELLLKRLDASQNNIEFLTKIKQSTPREQSSTDRG